MWFLCFLKGYFINVQLTLDDNSILIYDYDIKNSPNEKCDVAYLPHAQKTASLRKNFTSNVWDNINYLSKKLFNFRLFL